MVTFPEIAELFSQLACHLQTLTNTSPTDNQEEEVSNSIDLSISKLNQSLNLTEDAGVRVLDTALSLMCFNATQVFDSVIEYLVKTIVSVLSSSISCAVLRFEKEELLRVGSPISLRDCVKFIEVVNDVLPKLDELGMPSHLLFCAAARVAVSASCYRYLDVKSIDRRGIAIKKFLCLFPREFSLNNHEIPMRLLSWYLDPLTLKHDISNILQDIMKRPFLSPSKEFYERMEWRSVLMCLVLSPVMFVHSRALLHNWLMLTGLASVLQLLNELVAVILDVICRPTWWGLSMELGSKLPFSKAYFPHKHHWLRILAGPLSYSSFIQLVHRTSKSVYHVTEQFGLTSKPSATKVTSIDSKSIWALAICFPDWFYFASVLFFSSNSFQKNFQLKFTLGILEFGQTSGVEQPPAAAARYIAWILSPNNVSDQDLLFDGLTKISESWTLKQNNLGVHERGTADYGKKFKKPVGRDIKEDFSLENKCDCQIILLWLKEFQSFMRCGDESIDNSSPREAESYNFVLRNSTLLRRIPLGILIGCSSSVKEDGFELLLHYAATGKMLHLITKNARTKRIEQNSGGIEDFALGNEFNKNEAVAGACIVFSLTDFVERMSASLSNKEKSGLDIICQVKLRASRYLIKCINMLILHNGVENRNVMLVDLHDRLERWRHQGEEMLKLNKDVDDAIKVLSDKLLLLP